MLRVIATSSLALLLLAGCGAEDPSPEAALPTPPRTTAADPTGAPEPTEAPDASTEPQQPDASTDAGTLARRMPTTAPEPRALLLDATDLPVLADGRPWTTTSTTPRDAEAVGACQRASLTDIGAVSTLRRTFATGHGEAHDAAGAVQVVASFADARSATRALRVLESWRTDCLEHLRAPHRRVADLHAVPVPVGTAGAYRATYGPRARTARRLEGLAFLRQGATITVVSVEGRTGSFAGPRANPARRAVARLARRLG